MLVHGIIIPTSTHRSNFKQIWKINADQSGLESKQDNHVFYTLYILMS